MSTIPLYITYALLIIHLSMHTVFCSEDALVVMLSRAKILVLCFHWSQRFDCSHPYIIALDYPVGEGAVGTCL